MASLSSPQISENELEQLHEFRRIQEENEKRKKQIEEDENKKQRAADSINDNTVLTRVVVNIPVSQIIDDFDAEKHNNSDKKYRLPIYQRDSKPDDDWGEELVKSVLRGISIGSLHISEHIDDNNNKYHDIEDGRTRMIALDRFYNDKYTITINGDVFYFSDLPESLKSKINGYLIPCVKLEKKNSEIDVSVYKLALRDNFSKLQEGRQLSTHDLYWAQDNLEDGTSGSPLVIFAKELPNDQTISSLVKWCGATNMSRRGDKNRRPITQAASLVACAWKGNDANNYSKEDYNGKRDIINEPISQQEGEVILSKLRVIQDIGIKSLESFPKQQNERLGEFFKNKFTANIMEDIDNTGNMNMDNQNKWINLFTEIRKKKTKINKNDFLDTQVYKGLTKGAKQGNCNLNQIHERKNAIEKWWKDYKAHAAASS